MKKKGTLTKKNLNIPSSSAPFKNAPMAPRYPSCLRNNACWLPYKDNERYITSLKQNKNNTLQNYIHKQCPFYFSNRTMYGLTKKTTTTTSLQKIYSI